MRGKRNKRVIKGGAVIRDAYSMFNNKSLAWIFLSITFLLQIISFATTYSGSKIYFGGIKLIPYLSAPLIFALAIQVTVFVLSSSLKRNLRIWVVLILTVAVTCSTYFSYIGIYNYINSPVQYLEEKYTYIKDGIEKTLNANKRKSLEEMRDTVFKITGRMQKELSLLDGKIENNEKLIDGVRDLKRQDGVIESNTWSVKRPNINNYDKDNLQKYYDDMKNYNAAVASMKSDTAQKNSELANSLYNESVKGILGEKTLDQVADENGSLKSSRRLLESAVDGCYNRISQEKDDVGYSEKLQLIGDYCLEFISDGGDSETFEIIISKLFVTFNELIPIGIPENFIENVQVIERTLHGEELSMRELEDIEKEVIRENRGEGESGDIFMEFEDALLLQTKIDREIDNAIYKNNMLFSEKISKGNLAADMDSLYVLPINTLIEEGEDRSTAWFCLGFAAMVDGLTILFSLIQKKKRKILLAKRNKSITNNDEEIIENMIISALLAQDVLEEGKNPNEAALIRLMRFTSHFKILQKNENTGYSMFAPISQLENYDNLLSVLCQLNLGKIVDDDELKILGKDEDEKEESSENLALREVAATVVEEEKNGERYILIKTKFIIWTNDKFHREGRKGWTANE